MCVGWVGGGEVQPRGALHRAEKGGQLNRQVSTQPVPEGTLSFSHAIKNIAIS